MSQIITSLNEKKIINPVEQIEPRDGLKDSYGFVSTKNMLDIFESKGWHVSSISKVNPRNPDRKGFQRHLIRLENPLFPSIPGLSENNSSKPQICVLNSHDGTTALRLFLGILRIACLNGIIAGTSLRDFKAVHSKNVAGRIRDGIEYLSDNMQDLFNAIQTLQNSRFDDAGLAKSVRNIVDARLKNVNRVQTVNYESALKVRRLQDRDTDAWTMLNRIQESIVRGGIQYSYLRSIKDGDGNEIGTKTVHTRTRALRSVPSQVKLNRLIFDEAMENAS